MNDNLITISESNVGQRIDNFLVVKFKGVPKALFYKLMRKGTIRVNKGRIKPDYRLQLGDKIWVPKFTVKESPEIPVPHETLQQTLRQAIVYEDERFLILNKPNGMAVHGGSGLSYGVIECLRVMYPELSQLELVHRLDRDTSGCLIIAKKRSMLRYLHEVIRNGEMAKTYLCIVKGLWPKTCRVVDSPLIKNQLQSGERMVFVHPEGKPSITQFKVIRHFEDRTLLEAKLITGRTHQIRVHSASQGHPIIGDDKYGDKNFNFQYKKYYDGKLLLHAKSIIFQDKDSPNKLSFNVPIPTHFKIDEN